MQFIIEIYQIVGKPNNMLFFRKYTRFGSSIKILVLSLTKLPWAIYTFRDSVY